MRVRVPASSANLGPGFDCLGLAWELYDEIEFLPAEDRLHISGCDARYQNEGNLAWLAYRGTLERCGKAPCGLEIRFGPAGIPVSRGLGSSAALIVAGVLAADALEGLGLGRQEIFEIASVLEGHPDNAAPAVFGGLTASLSRGERVVTRRFPLSPQLRFTALVPPFPLSTREARAALPPRIPREDAVFNLSGTVLLLRALEEGDEELLGLCLEDRLHQPFRYPLIPGAGRAADLAEEQGAAGVCISGAGSTLLCFSLGEERTRGLREVCRRELPGWRVLSLRPELQGAAILP